MASERDFLNQGYRATQPLQNQPSPDVLPDKYRKEVTERSDKNRVQLRAYNVIGPTEREYFEHGYQAEEYALRPVIVVKAPKVAPREIGPVTIIPPYVEAPTMRLGIGPMPWSTGPEMSLMSAAASSVLGTLLITVGREAIAQMAMVIGQHVGMKILGSVKNTNTRIRQHTGKSAGPPGALKPRTGGSSAPVGRPEPYDYFNDWTTGLGGTR